MLKTGATCTNKRRVGVILTKITENVHEEMSLMRTNFMSNTQRAHINHIACLPIQQKPAFDLFPKPYHQSSGTPCVNRSSVHYPHDSPGSLRAFLVNPV